MVLGQPHGIEADLVGEHRFPQDGVEHLALGPLAERRADEKHREVHGHSSPGRIGVV